MSTKLKKCSTCDIEKPLSEFNWKNKDKGRLHSYCRVCAANYQGSWYTKNADRHKSNVEVRNKQVRRELMSNLIDYFRTHPCVDCKEENPVLLQFDHVNGKKSYCISTMLRNRYSWSRILSEIEKCVVRCVKCHTLKTAKDQGWYKDILQTPL